jgi:hypothetical protein
MSWRPGAL